MAAGATENTAAMILAISTVAIVAIVVAIIVALVAVMYLLPRGGRRAR